MGNPWEKFFASKLKILAADLLQLNKGIQISGGISIQGSVRKKGATWSYRVEFGVIDGKRHQIERSGFKTKGEATKAMQTKLLLDKH